MTNREKLRKEILNKINSDLSENTKKTYAVQILNAYMKINPNESKFKTNLLNNVKEIKNYVETFNNVNNRKTIYSSLLQVVPEDIKEEIKALMLNEINIYNVNIKNKTDSKNSIDFKDIKKKFNSLKKEYGHLLKKNNLNNFELYNLQKMIALAVAGGLFIPPRRNLDYINLKIGGDIDEKKDNFIDFKAKTFNFNKYKTSKTYGLQIVEIPPKLYSLLVLFTKLKKDHSNFLFSQKKGEPFISATWSQYLNSIFKSKISTNSFRHAFLTNKYSNTTELKEDLKDMGTSIKQLDIYVDKKKP